MTRYAQNTTVSPERSKAEIESILQRYGADEFASGWRHGEAIIQFKMKNRHIRFRLALPEKNDPEFTQTGTGRERSETAAFKEWEKGCRQRWRALVLSVKAKLETVESGIAVFEEEFMAQIIMPDGKTVSEHVLPTIAIAYKEKTMPPLLPGY